MDKLLIRVVKIQREYLKATKRAKELGPERNRLVAELAQTHSKAEIASALGLTSQRIIQIIKKERGHE